MGVENFHEVGPVGSLLVGVRYSTHLFIGRPKVSSMQPLYRRATGGSEAEGRRYGDVASPETVVIARPGYAVGAIRTRAGLALDGCVLVFMRIRGDQLDPSDAYDSPVIGDSQGGSPGYSFGGGRPAVGIEGRARQNVESVGLVLDR